MTTNAGRMRSIRCRSVWGGMCGLKAHGTAPSSCSAQKVSMKSRPAGSAIATRLPTEAPVDRSRGARAPARSASSPSVSVSPPAT